MAFSGLRQFRLRRTVALFVVVAVAACTGSPGAASPAATSTGPSSVPASATAPADPIKLTYWSHHDAVPTTEKCYEDSFTKFAAETGTNATLDAVIIPYSGYEAAYTAALQSDQGPDFFVGQAADWIDYLEPAPEAVATRLGADSLPQVAAVGVIDGVRYGVPQDGLLVQMLYINEDMFREAGLDPSKPPTNFDELIDYAGKLTKRDAGGNVTRAGFAVRHSGAPLGLADKFMPFAHGFGGRILSEDGRTTDGFMNGPKMVEALEWYHGLVTGDDAVASTKLEEPLAAFAGGQAAMMLRESFAVAYLGENAPDIKFSVFPPPVGPGGVIHLTSLFSWADLVNKAGPNKDLAWKFLDWLYLPENEVANKQCWAFMPITRTAWESDWAKSSTLYPVATELLKLNPGPAYPYIWANEVSSILGEAIGEVLFDKADAKSALDAAAVRAQQAIDRR